MGEVSASDRKNVVSLKPSAAEGECCSHNSIPFQGVDFSSSVKTGFKLYPLHGQKFLDERLALHSNKGFETGFHTVR